MCLPPPKPRSKPPKPTTTSPRNSIRYHHTLPPPYNQYQSTQDQTMIPTTSTLPHRITVKKSSSSQHKNGFVNTTTTEVTYNSPPNSDQEISPEHQIEEHNHITAQQKRRKSVFDDIEWVQLLSDKIKPAPPSPTVIAAQKAKEEADVKEREDLKMIIRRIEEEKIAEEEREKQELRRKVMEMTSWKIELEREDVKRKEEGVRAEWMSQIHGLRGEITGMRERGEVEKAVRTARVEGMREGEEKGRKERGWDERYLLREREREREDRFGGRDGMRYLPIAASSLPVATPSVHLHLLNTPSSQESSISHPQLSPYPNHRDYPPSDGFNYNSVRDGYGGGGVNRYGYRGNGEGVMMGRTVERERELRMGEVRGLNERVGRVESRLGGVRRLSRGVDGGMGGLGYGAGYWG